MENNEEKEIRILAKKHGDFLANKVFKPAFVMAFIHGYKHGKQDKDKKNEER